MLPNTHWSWANVAEKETNSSLSQNNLHKLEQKSWVLKVMQPKDYLQEFTFLDQYLSNLLP